MYQFLDFLADRGAASIHARGRIGTYALISELPANLSGPVLEVGCGTGETAALLCTRGEVVVGADASPRMLASAMGRARWCGVADSFFPVRNSGAMLPFDDQTFSAVVVESVLAIQSSQGVRQLVREIRRVVRPGGRVLINESVWLPSVSIELATETNRQAVASLGIVQAVVDPFDADGWVQMFEAEKLQLVRRQGLDQAVEVEIANFGFRLRSRAYTAIRRVRYMASLKALKRARHLNRRVDDLSLPYRCLEGVLFVLERQGP